ncbi:hypothetical protein [Clostridium paraputrificum]|uniref:hypothetical protein n=1 Tax=Clostridium paraputrificum TaxID=29363 RepID=UPI0035674F3F
MILHFNVTGEKRKDMVKAIEKELDVKSKYLGMPSAAYQIGSYKVLKDGTLEFDVTEGIEESSKVIDACVMATGTHPEEWDENPTEEPQGEDVGLTVAMPKNYFTEGTLENLKAIVASKQTLIKKALGLTELPIEETDEKVSFPWFGIKPTEDDAVKAYTHFIYALCEMAKNQKRVNAKEKDVENEKYAFRCFLLRLGFIGNEYKQERKILLQNFTGSAAFKNGGKSDDVSK